MDLGYEIPIEEISHWQIGCRIDVTDAQGRRCGFRLARYQQAELDGQLVWRLTSEAPPVTVEVSAGTMVSYIVDNASDDFASASVQQSSPSGGGYYGAAGFQPTTTASVPTQTVQPGDGWSSVS